MKLLKPAKATSQIREGYCNKEESAPFELAPGDRISCIIDRQRHFNNTRKFQRYGVKSHERKSESAGHAHTNHSPAGLDDGGVGETTAQIPHQVTKAVEAVVGKGESHGGLEGNLGGEGESTEGGHHGGRLQVPAERGRGEVSGSPQVEGAGECDAGNTVQGRANPGDLGLVDGKVRGNRTVQALLSQDLGGVLGVGGRGDGSRY